MFKIFKIILITFTTILGIMLLCLIIAYFSLSENYNPPQTVTQNKKLPYIQLNGIKFHTHTYGNNSNQTIIILHSGPGNDFKNLLHLKNLSDKYFIVFYDQRGSGLTQRVTSKQLTYHNYLSDIKEFVKQYSNNKKVILIGQSWGANLALYFTAQNPNLIDKLILASPTALNNQSLKILNDKINSYKTPNFSNILNLILCWLKSLHVNGPDDNASKDFLMKEYIYNSENQHNPLSFYYGGKIPQTEKNIWRFGADASKFVIKSMLNPDGFYKNDLMMNFNEFLGETYIFTGSNDKITGTDFQLKQSSFYHFTKIIEIENCGHNFFSEKPNLSLQKIKEILYD